MKWSPAASRGCVLCIKIHRLCTNCAVIHAAARQATIGKEQSSKGEVDHRSTGNIKPHVTLQAHTAGKSWAHTHAHMHARTHTHRDDFAKESCSEIVVG